MKTHTSGFKSNIKQFGRELDSKITYELDGSTVELGKEELNSINPHYKSSLLKSTMKQLDVDSNVEIPEGTIINYQFAVKVGNSYEYINYGSYIVYSIEKQEDTNSYLIKCYDKMLYAMKDYEAPEITYPTTVREYITALCTKIGLTFKNENEQFVNYNKEIPEELYLTAEGQSLGYTYRDVLDELAEATASIICINEEDDELEIRYIKDVGIEDDKNGSYITIDSGAEAELSSFELEGKTTQETSESPVMPSPDYPSELVSVGYENLFNFEETSSSGSGLNSTIKGTNLTIEGTATSGSKNITGLLPNPYKAGDYVFSITEALPRPLILRFYDNNNATIRSATIPAGSTFIQFTLDGTETQYRLIFNPTSGNSYNFEIDLMLTKGMEIYSYIPYGKYGIEIKNVGKNLFQGGDSVTSNGITFTKNNDGTYNITGTSTATAVCDNYVNIKDTCIINAETYTISANQQLPSGVYIQIEAYDGSTYLRKVLGSDNVPNTAIANITDATRIRFRLRVNNGITVNISNLKIQLERGNQATTYETYRSNSQLYILNEPLRGIENIKDKLFIKNGFLYIERKIGSVILNGSVDENWKVQRTKTNSTYFQLNDIVFQATSASSAPNSLCNYFTANTGNNLYSQDIEGFTFSTGGNLRINVLNTIASTVNDLKTWLSTHNTEIQYELAEPQIEELGQIEMPSTYEGITYINTTDNLQPNMNITYISELDEIDEEFMKNINVNFGEKFGPINTVILSRSGGSDKIAQSIPADIMDENKIAIEITENQIMNDNNRADFIPEILNKLNGTEYYINDFASTGICYYNLGDRYRIKIFENKYKCIMLNDDANITQGLEENVYTEKPEEAEKEYKHTSTDDRKINQTYIIAKKNEGKIEAVVESVDGENGLTNRVSRVEATQTSTNAKLNIISTHIDDATGDVREVKTTTGFTFDAEGMTIEDSNSNFKALHRNTGTYYKDGNTIVGQYTKDGSKQKDLELFGVYYYGKEDINDTPMFVAQLYTDGNGEEGVGHFYNGGE